MFEPVSSRVSFPEIEERVLKFWKDNDIFEKSVQNRLGRPLYVFYEGPPTANGVPGIHHVLARIFKDIVNRYRTMRGYLVPRKGGWDTHGLPVELEIEKELGLSSKAEIEAYGVEQFNARCRESVFRYVKEWEAMTERIGYWVDIENAYVTYKNEYIESCWWILKQLWDRGLLYQGYRVAPYCSRCGTGLSSHEVAQGYRDTSDPSIYVKFEVASGPLATRPDSPQGRTYLLAWTTTPWTLPGNAALAVAPYAEYVVVQTKSEDGVPERLILARALADVALNTGFTIVQTLHGSDLVGTTYIPLYRPMPLDKPAHRVIAGDFVSLEDGTGIVHIAPAFGEIDLEVGKAEDLPIIQTVDLQGNIVGVDPRFAGLFVKDADPLIMDDLKSRGLLYRREQILHTYPFCWRCETPLLYYAKTSWYIQTTAKKDALLAANEQINWYPEYIKHGRFGDWLENNVDWALSRERYWGTPLPIWKCETCGEYDMIGSVAELEKRSGQSNLHETLDLHRPFVDRITIKCTRCNGTMRRISEVIDAWFDSGAMPVAQWHYPFQNQDLFAERFPADFISEAVDQTRGWFYSLHALAVLLFDSPAYRNVISLGHVVDAKGEKMSKSRGNVIDPWLVLNSQGADALRWYFYTATPPGNVKRFSVDLVSEVVRKFLLTLWNTYSFFVTYANIDQFVPGKAPALEVPKRELLDRWILSELNTLIRTVNEGMDGYDVTGPGRAIQTFVDNLSNWYVRRSRRRFWKSENDADKLAAYETLYECLVTVAKLMAPFTPFIAEALYQNLVRSVDPSAPESVHLTDFPVADTSLIDPQLEEDTSLVMRIASLGRAARSKAAIKVRQPVAELLVKPRSASEKEALRRLTPQIVDELNVKTVSFVDAEADLVTYNVKGRTNLLGPKYGRDVPAVLKAISQLDPYEVARRVRAGATIKADGYTLEPSEVEIIAKSRDGYAVAEEADYLVAISTTLTPELIEEGLARELVHRIQTMRKDADFRIEDHIVTYYQGDDVIERVFQKHQTYIKQETLSDELRPGEPTAGAYEEEVKVDGHRVKLAVAR